MIYHRRYLLRDGVAAQEAAFRDGLDDVLPGNALAAFTPVEASRLVCGRRGVHWTEVSLLSDICPEQGLTTESSSVRLLVQTLVGMSQLERSEFLLLTTRCPHLPPGGMAGLQPRFKVQPRPALPLASTWQRQRTRKPTQPKLASGGEQVL